VSRPGSTHPLPAGDPFGAPEFAFTPLRSSQAYVPVGAPPREWPADAGAFAYAFGPQGPAFPPEREPKAPLAGETFASHIMPDDPAGLRLPGGSELNVRPRSLACVCAHATRAGPAQRTPGRLRRRGERTAVGGQARAEGGRRAEERAAAQVGLLHVPHPAQGRCRPRVPRCALC
jgi:hypothetical protein